MNVISQEVNFQAKKLWEEYSFANQYIIHKSDNTTWNVVLGKSPEKIGKKSNPNSLKDILVVEVSPTERFFFGAIYQKDTVVFSERRLWVENAPNFRD